MAEASKIEWTERGRSVASNGYRLIRVGKGHPLADVRGYAYEHRLIAQKKYGRQLRAGEVVHHIDGDKLNNDPSNLEVMPSIAHHAAEHRSRSDKRDPGEPNQLMWCACGCGSTLSRYDDQGRPRRYISGHNPMPSPTRDAIRKALGEGPEHRTLLAQTADTSIHAIGVALTRMKKAGEVEPCGNGFWRLANG